MDIISDFIIRIQNGSIRRKLSVKVKNSKYICNILNCLTKQGFIRGYKLDNYDIEVLLKYKDDRSVINKLIRISKSSNRIYYSYSELQENFLKNELLVLSTNKGIFTDKEIIGNQLNLGGEVLFKII